MIFFIILFNLGIRLELNEPYYCTILFDICMAILWYLGQFRWFVRTIEMTRMFWVISKMKTKVTPTKNAVSGDHSGTTLEICGLPRCLSRNNLCTDLLSPWSFVQISSWDRIMPFFAVNIADNNNCTTSEHLLWRVKVMLVSVKLLITPDLRFRQIC